MNSTQTLMQTWTSSTYRWFRHTEFDIDSYEPYYEWDIALLYIDEEVPFGEHQSQTNSKNNFG